MTDIVEQTRNLWRALKRLLEFEGAVSTNHLHIIFGLIIFIAAYFLSKAVFKHAKPKVCLLFVFIAQTLNELIDIILGPKSNVALIIRNSLWDYYFTLIGPICLILGAILVKYLRHKQGILKSSDKVDP